MHTKRLNFNDSEHVRDYALNLCKSHNIKIEFAKTYSFKYSYRSEFLHSIFIGEKGISRKLLNLVILHEIQHELLKHVNEHEHYKGYTRFKINTNNKNHYLIKTEIEAWREVIKLFKFDKEILNFVQTCINSYVFNVEVTELTLNRGLWHVPQSVKQNKPKKVSKMEKSLKEQRNLFNSAEMTFFLEIGHKKGGKTIIYRPKSPKRLNRRK